MKTVITILIVFACLGFTFSLNCLSCQDENGNSSSSCSSDTELTVTECSTEEPVCGMYYHKGK